jgi:exopolysaccharide biosynthesis protein
LTEGTRDASEFQPALIIDGEVYYNDGWNSPNPRVVLGQTSRLETIMVASEGSLPDSLGAGTNDVALVMLQYGCVQALNMDGGTSAMMTYKGEPVIRCRNTNLPEGRTLPTAWVYHYSE